MRHLTALLAFVLLAGCTAPPQADEVGPQDGAVEADAAQVEPYLIEWHGKTVVGVLDMRNHDAPTEQVIFPVQQAGFLVDIPTVPQAIEVRVDWRGDGAFMLHPHWLKGDEGGRTKYYGYHSALFTSGTGCIRLTDADMASGVWPMMIHPSSDTINVDFTITVGILGATGTVLSDLHGHRADGAYDIEEHEIGECQYLAAA